MPGSWFTIPAPNPKAAVRLFCLPYAGGGASIFRTWRDYLPPAVEIWPVHLPGRELRISEESIKDWGLLLRELGRALRPHLDRPFVLVGHSMGAIISYEIARYLRREYRLLPAHLFVSGHRAPQVAKVQELTYTLPTREFIKAVRKLNDKLPEVLEHPELQELVLPMLRADLMICETYNYVPELPLECPITAFGGLNDKDVPREHLEAWREHTTKNFTLRLLPGDHFFFRTEQQLLLRAIGRELHTLLGSVAS